MTGSGAGRVLVDGRDTGSGFAITDGRALTAGHVVRPVTDKMPGGQQLPVAGPPAPAVVCVRDGGEPCPVRAVVEYWPEGAEPIPVTRVQVCTSLDVAVLDLQRPAPAVLPAGPVTAGAEWRVETRPKASDPALTGTVTDPHRRLQNQHGIETTLVQLWVREELGDYRGYSGIFGEPGYLAGGGRGAGPGAWGAGRAGTLAGQPSAGQPAPVANVLFAAPIGQVLAEFGLAGVSAGEPAGTIPLPPPFEVRRPQLLPGNFSEAAQVAQECGYLPLALALCGAMIAAGGHSWPQLLDLLHHADLEALHSRRRLQRP